jgi:hypothetical protein
MRTRSIFGSIAGPVPRVLDNSVRRVPEHSAYYTAGTDSRTDIGKNPVRAGRYTHRPHVFGALKPLDGFRASK